MARIYKYPMPEPGKPFDLKINGFCEVVHVGIDSSGAPCIWAIVAPDKPEETWTYLAVPTGAEIDTTEWCFIRSFHFGGFLWHLLRPVSQWKQ